VESGSYKSTGPVLALYLAVLWVLPFFSWPLLSQQNSAVPAVPEKFNMDQQTAARLRPQLIAQSTPASGQYETARLVFERLSAQVRPGRDVRFSWELRIVDDDLLNAFASPDGTIYVDRGLAELAGQSAGLWAAILSHEIAHVVRRDWARRYLYEQSLQSGATVVLGDPGPPSADWTDSNSASLSLARFCRQMELDADIEGLRLMARAGYHPDFAPALHHLLHSWSSGANNTSLYAMHPCWEERDRELQHAYVAASIEFEHLWHEWYASPGGNPPVVVFAEDPKIRRTGTGNNGASQWEIQVPMRCQNLAGAVEVVLRARRPSRSDASVAETRPGVQLTSTAPEMRQLTGCTSPTTTVTFALGAGPGQSKLAEQWTDVYVLDAWGTVLSRREITKLHR
jgi:Zn-dependent protease with chaperone function